MKHYILALIITYFIDMNLVLIRNLGFIVLWCLLYLQVILILVEANAGNIV